MFVLWLEMTFIHVFGKKNKKFSKMFLKFVSFKKYKQTNKNECEW